MLKSKERRNESSEMTVSEAGRKGGKSTSRNHDREFFIEIGTKGGRARARKIQEGGISEELRDRYSEGGRKGGETTKARYGIEHYHEIGKKGGSVPKKKKDDEEMRIMEHWVKSEDE